MKTLLGIGLFLFLSGCNPSEVVPPEMLKKQWIYRQLTPPEGAPEDFEFIYGDIITTVGDSLKRIRSLENEAITRFALQEAGVSLPRTIRFRQPDTTQLIVEHYLDDVKSGEFNFEAFQPEKSGHAMLRRLLEKTYRFEIDTAVHYLRLHENPEPDDELVRFQILRGLPDTLRNRSARNDDRRPHFYVRITPNGHFPTYSFFSYSAKGVTPIPNIMLTDVYPNGDLEFLLPPNSPTDRYELRRATAVPNERTNHLSADEMFYLLSQGAMTIDRDPDFREDTYVHYGYDHEFAGKGLRLEELAEVGFSFSADGIYDVFHKNRSLAGGQYHLSRDGGYLMLKKGQYYQAYPLYSAGPDHLAFRYDFQVATPRPLGERLFSDYTLGAVVHFRTPE